jgi:hypothetical protein
MRELAEAKAKALRERPPQPQPPALQPKIKKQKLHPLVRHDHKEE